MLAECARERRLIIGGFVASWTMNRFQDGWSKVSQARERSRRAQDSPRRLEPHPEEKAQESDEAAAQT